MREVYKLVIEALIKSRANNGDELLKEFRKIVPPDQWGLFQILFFGVQDWQSHLLAVLESFSSLKLKKFRDKDLYLLLIAIYGLLYLDKPQHALVNEAVELMKTQNKKLVPMTNAILRNILREEDLDRRIYGGLNLRDSLSRKYDFPPATIEVFLEELGEGKTREVLESSKGAPRLDFLVLHDEALALNMLEEEGHDFKALDLERAYTMLKNKKPLDEIRAYRQGRIYYQSLNSQRIASFIPQGRNLLDLCGAPGGKSFALLAREPERQVTICDISQSKVDLIQENASRLKLKLDVRRWDARDFNAQWEESFSGVLVDAPCSATGILHRQRGESSLKDLGDLEELLGLQAAILSQAASYVENHGFLIYSTCSILRSENENQIEDFLAKNPDFHLVKPRAWEGYFFKSFPIDGEDGFFACVMEKSKL